MDGHSGDRWFKPLFKLFYKEKEDVSKEAIIDLISRGNENGVINETAKDMLYGVFQFNDKVATEVMTSRVEVISIDRSLSTEEIMDIVLNSNFSRIPVYEGDVYNIIGILNAKDFLSEVCRIGLENIDVDNILKKPYFVPETKKIQRLFKELQYTKNHMAILLDEYGDFAGIVTVEDIVGEIVGDMVDENEEALDEDIIPMGDGSYLVDGLTHIDDVNKHLQLGIECEHFDTIGGFVVNLIGNIPKSTQQISVSYNNIVFEVKQVKANRVEKLRILLPSHIAV